ncbi:MULTISPECIES: nucleoside triphosphate pyrophosphohydrolase [Shewanella]|uniref:Nucleoside triphosphate pyrophosphohydrolase n=1 Tax=Shewanella metallivivens TaxID=2872342 RepID=A0ABT5TJI5_9GAMM|nr:nucleoside triphosphate pyrophosphohydrolase [Shewanella metallivivens]
MANIQSLLDIMKQLRDPQTGCPWDLAQNFATIVPFTLEEAYEVVDTIERQAWQELPDELGDLLFQVVFYCQLAQEQGMFDFATVVGRISDKLTRRHPHVFARADGQISDAITNTQELSQAWDKLKANERQQKQLHSALDDIPQALPALSRARKIQHRVAKVGFDWAELEPVVAKIHEEIDEVLFEVNKSHDDPAYSQAHIQDEMGDLLFAVVNLARHLKVDPEQALRQANNKFERRFRGVEHYVADSGKAIEQHTLSELDGYWDKVKQDEKAN